nr:retrovirus-related Pol polyprotein from transposon TNT 1-94 [Tanacetum cinerariifolium]
MKVSTTPSPSMKGVFILTRNTRDGLAWALPRRRDATYLQTQLLNAEKEEAGIQLQAEEYDLMAAATVLDEIEEVNANCILMANLQQASSSSTQTDSTPVYDSDGSAEVTNVEQDGETVEQHSANFEETRALYESLYQNSAVEVDKVNSVNRKLKETNADMTTELARYKNQKKCFEISQEKYDKLERCYQKSVYQEQCLSKKINAIHLSTDKQIMTLNEQISDLNKQLSKEKSTVSFLLEEKKKLKSNFKTCKDELLDKQIQLEKRIKELNNIVLKTGQSIQTIHMLSPKPDSFYHTKQKMALGYQNPFYLKQAQKKQQSLYDGKVLLAKHDPIVVHDSEETLQHDQESRQKMKQMNKEIKPTNYTKINHLSGVFVPQTALSREELYFSNISKTANVSKSISIPNEDLSDDTTPSVARKFLNEVKSTIVTLQRVVKQRMTIETHNWASSAHQEFHKIQNFVGDFKSLAKEADASLAKHKILELEIERLLKAVKLENENVELEFQVLNYARENTHLKGTYKNLFDSISVSRVQTKTKIASLQNELQSNIYKNAKLRTQLFKKVSDQKDNTHDLSKNTKFAKQPNVEFFSKIGKTNALSKPVTSNSVSTLRESKGVNNAKVIAPGMFRISSDKISRETKKVPNTVSDQKDNTQDLSKNTKFAKQPNVEILSKIGETNALSKPVTSNSVSKPPVSKGVNNAKVIAPGMFRISPDKVSREAKKVPNITTLRPEDHSLGAIQRMIGKSRGRKHKANVSNNETQQKNQLEIKKPKKVGFIRRLVTPKPRKPRFLLRWSLTGKMFDQDGKLVVPSNSESHVDCSNGCSKHMTGNLKLFINFVWKFLGTVRFGNDHVAAILGFGDLQWGNILITRVYFIEGLDHNLFSVGQFCDSDLEVAFRRNACFVRNLEGVDLLKGDCLLKFKYHKEHLCPSCEQGKRKRASHPPKPVPNLRQRLHLLHMDLCGPMRIASINGKRSGLDLTYDSSTIMKQQPTEGELHLLFESMYDDYFGGQPLANVENVPTAPEPLGRQTSTASTTTADNVPIPTNSSSHATNIPIPSQDVDELNPNAMVDGNTWSPTGKMFDSAGKLVAPSGCSKHMTGNLKLLINFSWKFMGTVRFGNDHVAAILGFGDLQWGNILITRWGNIVIARVYFVEGLGHNLFSVGQFCDSDLEVAFRRNACFVRNLEGVDLLKGDRSTNLYTINLHEMASASPICLMARASSTKSWLWHQRLSHLNFDTINDLAKNDFVAGLLKFKYHKEHLCPSCEKGKSKRASRPPKPVPNLRQRLHLLHMDLCGPMRITSINGKRYILVIVDVYSRYTWVHFLRSKDEAPIVIITFLKRITVLLQSPVIIIRTDNGTEFKNQGLKVYFDSVGITHQMYYVQTPQQNGVVERQNRTLVEAARTMLIFSRAPLFLWLKRLLLRVSLKIAPLFTNGVVERRNRTLVEAARTMLIFSRAPLFLWAEAIATPCFTQNRSIIYRRFNKTSYELINGRKPDISFLHVFGALCYPKNDREEIGKLGAKGDIGFFTGYSADSCAYIIYNRQTKKIMVTMNVSFDELSAMAFEQCSSKPGLQCMTSGQISSGLDLTYAPSTITTQQPTKGELDSLFEAMYDDYFGGQPSANVENVPTVQEPQVRQTSTASTSSADNVPIATNSSSHATNIPIPSQDVDELNPNAMVDGNTFVNPFANPSTSAAQASSSSQNVDPSNLHTFYQPYPHEFQWTKDHPLEQVIGDPS